MNELKYAWPRADKSRWGKFRDDLAYRIATFAFEKIATEWYAKMIAGSIAYGLASARRDERESRSIPTADLIPRRSRKPSDAGGE